MQNSAVLLNYFFFLLSLGAEIPKTDVKAKLSMKFEDVRPGKKVRNDAVIKTIIFLKLYHLACARHATCPSYTICGGRHVCQLNREDVCSTDLGEGILVDDATCKYFGLSRNEVPTCVDAGTFVDIKNDNRTGVCGINGKRVDHQWSGDFFYKLSDTLSQLDWLSSKADETYAWLGGYRVDDAQWERADGQTFRPSDLIWLTGQPSGGVKTT